MTSPGADPAARSGLRRCSWARAGTALDIAYHDSEWGVPVRDDRVLFEF
ncbi:MAG: DNA-3-methyladenine glycosylase I, partial [Pseudomonadota bacterium]|nr:DNA-3-methyladenine glycosylase I [Pseudomonadota bacterium]